MISDSERREVAARLRSLDDERIAGKIALNSTWTFLDVLDETLFGERKFKMWHERLGYITSRLADLIEPNEPKVKCVAEVKVDGERLENLVHDAAVELTGIDRDALLKLADELEQETGSVCGVCMGKSASRIRKALGVES